VALLGLATNASYLKNSFTLAHLASAAYADDPAGDAAFKKTVFTSASTFANDATKTFGFVTANEDHVVVSFRGTQDVQNWITNIQIAMRKQGGVYVHNGFAAAVDTVWDDMLQLLKDSRDNGQNVWVTGHSLGGALANWTAFWLTGALEPVSVATFGQPRLGDLSFAKKYKLSHHRFVNNHDIVPTVPIRQVPGHLIPPAFYTHVNKLHFFDGSRDLVEDSEDELGVAPLLRAALGPFTNQHARAAALVLSGLEDHKIKHYIECLDQNQP
jgi:hypothetical protein